MSLATPEKLRRLQEALYTKAKQGARLSVLSAVRQGVPSGHPGHAYAFDRSKEHLGPADKAISQARRLLLGAIKTVQAGGPPRGINPTHYTLRASEGVLPRDADWREVLTPEMATAEILQTV